MENKVFFSIIIPTYNRGHLISKTIDSIIKQHFSCYEIIIVDDGSTDNTEDIVRPFLSKNIKYYKKENAERATARNYGTVLAKGDYVNWFDSDDLALPNHLMEAENFCLQLNKPEVLHLAYQYNKPNEALLRSVSSFSSINNTILYLGNNLSCNGVFVRRDISLKNLFNEDRTISASEDYELWLRLAAQYPIYCSNVITSVIVQHDERSVLTMGDSDKLIQRFTGFLKYINSSELVVEFLGVNLKYFNMKNYLLLSVDLAVNGHKKDAIKYLLIACRCSLLFLKEKTFYATIKWLLLSKR